eukprot:scaffold178073_cov20-Tisochrysis_lutea.AAC.3
MESWCTKQEYCMRALGLNKPGFCKRIGRASSAGNLFLCACKCAPEILQDYAWIGQGAFQMPWDMVTPNKQYNPLYILNR